MGKKYKYNIGDWVEVSATVEFVIQNEQRKPVRNIYGKPFTAQIVGATYRQIGIFHSGCYNPYGGGDPAYLEVKGTVLVWLVRRGMINRQIEVLPDDLSHALSRPNQQLPWRYSTPVKLSDRTRQFLREDALMMPRKNGRFNKV